MRGVIALAGFAALDAEAFTYSSRSYVQKGLIGHFDAVDNAGFGSHDNEATEWKNLAGTNVIDHFDVTALKSHEWSDGCLTLSSGTVNPDSPQRLVTKRPITLTQFTFENVARTGSNKGVRRWDLVPWTNWFESWSNNSEGYLERLNNGTKSTRIQAYNTEAANRDIHFVTTYDAITHCAGAFVDGVRSKTTGNVPGIVINNKPIAFFSGMTAGRAYALRVYDRALEDRELLLNEVLDQLRFFGKTPQNVVLPQGCEWSFDADGVLYDEYGRALLRPIEACTAREVTGVDFSVDGEATILTATLGAATEGVTNALYLAWGDKDYGDDIADWPQFSRVKLASPEETSVSFAAPQECIMHGENISVRVFASVASRPFDRPLRYVTAKGNQWLITDYYANPKTVADFTVELRDLTVQQRVFGADGDKEQQAWFNFSCYINGGGAWAWSCNDGTGFWDNTGAVAKSELTRITITSPGGYIMISSPTYNGHTRVRNGGEVKRTRTSTCRQGIFVGERSGNTDHIHPVRDADLHFGSYSEDGRYVHTYEPCVMDGRGALYDRVTGRVYFSSTGSDFLIGAGLDRVIVDGELPTTCSATAALPKSVFSVNTFSTPTQFDYPLVYAEGGSKRGPAPLTLTNAGNAFGVFTVYEGALVADFGAGLAATDHLVLDGGVWATGTAAINATIGTGAGEVELKGACAGFAAKGVDAALTVNGGTGAIVYPSANFNPDKLLFNDKYCTGTITLAQQLQNGDNKDISVEIASGKVVFGAGMAATKKFTRLGSGAAEFRPSANTFGGFEHSAGSTTFSGTANEVCSMNVAGTLNVKGGTLNLSNMAATVKTVELRGGMIVVGDGVGLTSQYFKGYAGSVTQNGGVVRATSADTGSMSFSPGGNQTFTYRLNGGTLERTPSVGNFQLGSGGSNSVSRLYVENEGRLVTHCQYPSIGRWRHNKGELYVRNGGCYYADSTTADGAELCAGDEGHGYIEVAGGGEIDLDGYLKLVTGYEHVEREGEFRVLDGGLITCLGIWRDTAPCKRAQVVLDGGTVRVRQSSKTLRDPFMQNMTMANIGVNGTTIDTNGRDIRFKQDLTPLAGQTWTQPATAEAVASCKAFTKTGAGTLTLEGENSYSVATCVAEGTLRTATAGALPTGGLVKLAGGTLDLNGASQTIDALAGAGSVIGGDLAVTGTVWPGVGAEGGTLTVSGGTLTAGKLRYAVTPGENGPMCGKLVCNGTLDLTGGEIVVDDVENLGDRGCLILQASTLVGNPSSNLPRPYRVVRSGNALRVIASVGTVITFR